MNEQIKKDLIIEGEAVEIEPAPVLTEDGHITAEPPDHEAIRDVALVVLAEAEREIALTGRVLVFTAVDKVARKVWPAYAEVLRLTGSLGQMTDALEAELNAADNFARLEIAIAELAANATGKGSVTQRLMLPGGFILQHVLRVLDPEHASEDRFPDEVAPTLLQQFPDLKPAHARIQRLGEKPGTDPANTWTYRKISDVVFSERDPDGRWRMVGDGWVTDAEFVFPTYFCIDAAERKLVKMNPPAVAPEIKAARQEFVTMVDTVTAGMQAPEVDLGQMVAETRQLAEAIEILRRQRRKLLLIVGGVLLALALLICAWLLWPHASAEAGQVLESAGQDVPTVSAPAPSPTEGPTKDVASPPTSQSVQLSAPSEPPDDSSELPGMMDTPTPTATPTWGWASLAEATAAFEQMVEDLARPNVRAPSAGPTVEGAVITGPGGTLPGTSGTVRGTIRGSNATPTADMAAVGTALAGTAAAQTATPAPEPTGTATATPVPPTPTPWPTWTPSPEPTATIEWQPIRTEPGCKGRKDPAGNCVPDL